MKVIDNHFEGKPTLFINGLIINGCQTFTLEEAPEVFKKFDVPSNVQQDVFDNYVQEGYQHSQEELDLLVNHKSPNVRRHVAALGYGLDKLVHDPACKVRRYVADQGYGLDILVHDEDWKVRAEVAYRGYGLDILVNDSDHRVRMEVADQGYGLDTLINDSDYSVQCIAKAKLESLTS